MDDVTGHRDVPKEQKQKTGFQKWNVLFPNRGSPGRMS